MPESDADSTAPGEAFAGDMSLRKEMPDRREQRTWEFYYKSCSATGKQSYYSKTDYHCSGPYW